METIRKASYICQEGSSNKVYHFQMVKVGEGQFVINFQYGPNGGTLKPGTKTATPVDEKKANKQFDAMMAERLSKHYTGGEDGAKESAYGSSDPKQPKEIILLPQLLNEIQEDEVEKYLNDDEWMLEKKYDGERRTIFVRDEAAFGGNKKGEKVLLPDSIIKGLDLNIDVVLDGEIIGEDYYAFDILSYQGQDISILPALERVKFLHGVELGSVIKKCAVAATREAKRKLYNQLKEENAEGAVFKRKSAKYKSGRPNTGGDQIKFKFVKTASVIVEKITQGKRSVEMQVLGENGKPVNVGKVTIPANHDIPNVGDVVEVRYLYAYKGGAMFQSVYLGKRNDVTADECLQSQLVYKA